MECKQLPYCAINAILVCQMVVKGDGESARALAVTVMKNFFRDIAEGNLSVHLTQEGHLECMDTHESDPSGS